MTTVFILVNGEDWTWIAQDWIKAYGKGNRRREELATLFFIAVMFIGHISLFALFTGMLLHIFKDN